MSYPVILTPAYNVAVAAQRNTSGVRIFFSFDSMCSKPREFTSFIHSFIFTTSFPLGRVAGTTAAEGLETPHVGEDRNKDRIENCQYCGVWKLPLCDHRTIKVTQNCSCFTNPCTNLVPPSHLLQCIAAFLQHTLIGFLTRHNKSVFFVLIFIPAWSHAAENRSNLRQMHSNATSLLARVCFSAMTVRNLPIADNFV